MRNKTFFRSFTFCTVFISSFFYSGIVNAQTIKMQCISSYGSSNSNGSVFISQTAGQAFSTKGNKADVNIIYQGFQQSKKFIVELEKVELEKSLLLEIFPNPAKYSISIRSEDAINECKVSVFNSSGSIILNESVDNLSSYELDCSNWSNGIYFIRVYDSNQKTQTLKLIISK